METASDPRSICPLDLDQSARVKSNVLASDSLGKFGDDGKMRNEDGVLIEPE